MRRAWIIGGIVVAVAVTGGAFAWYRDHVGRQLGGFVANWIHERRAEGYLVEVGVAPTGGSLATVTQELTDAVITAPGDGWRLRLPHLTIAVDTWDPFGVDFLLQGEAELHYAAAGRTRRLTATLDGDVAGFRYSPNGPITSAHLRLRGATLSGPLKIRPELLDGALRLHPNAGSDPESRTFDLRLTLKNTEIVHPAALPLGQQVQRLEIDAYVTGALGQGRPSQVLAAWRDAGGVVQVGRLVADWGPLATSSEGTLALDERLQPIGAFTAEVRGYNEAIDAAVAARLMTPNQAAAAKVWLNARAQRDDLGFKVRLPLTIQDSVLSMGPIRLARMPRIAWE